MRIYLLASVYAFIVSLLFCAVLIPILRKMKAGQNILTYVKEHKDKKGTPTMGGLAFIFAAVLIAICFIKRGNRQAYITLVVGLAYLLVGFLDDYLKHKHKENLGLHAWQKLVFQCLIAIFVSLIL